MKCRRCKLPAQVKLPSHHTGFCPRCFTAYYLRQIERAVKKHAMFAPGEKLLVALSGGKDSLALMHALGELGFSPTGLHVSLGIPGSSAEALAMVRAFCERFGFALEVVDTPSQGLAVPEVKKAQPRRPICSMCGKIKRHLFNRFAVDNGFEVLATGHNLDDECARLFANTLRWDAAYLADQGPVLPAANGFARKVKPLYRLTEFENAAYAFFAGIEYGAVPCPYSPGATFTGHKELLEQLEYKSPGTKIAFYESFLKNARPAFAAAQPGDEERLAPCRVCASPTLLETCGVCRLREMVAARSEQDG